MIELLDSLDQAQCHDFILANLVRHRRHAMHDQQRVLSNKGPNSRARC